MAELRYRAIHLDFHTSGDIPGVGGRFDPDEFAETLQRAHVNAVTCFARGHHGWIYYPSEVHPERVHPHLQTDLLGRQIEACHARDIMVPIYTTVQWDHYTATRHPEWLCVDENGSWIGTRPFEAGFYRRLCLNSPYVDLLVEHTTELLERFDCDGFFFDIVHATPCCCRWCVEGMTEEGMNPEDQADRQRYAFDVLLRFQERMSGLVREHQPEANIFYNSGHIGPAHRAMREHFTHFELESLPGGGWRYAHFPVAQRYARTLGLPTISHTGRFHTTWGDFHSYRNPAALEYECMRMLALNCRCEIGDQLHPTGEIEAPTYDLVGEVYARVEAAEPWCHGAEAVVDIGVMTPEEFAPEGTGRAIPPATFGATKMLQELRHQFDVIDSQTDLSGYRLIVLADEIPVGERLAAKLGEFVAGGGAVLASHRSGLDPAGERFALEELGVRYLGEAPYSPDFIVPGKLGEGLRDAAYVMYMRGTEVEPMDESEVLSPMMRPYFNRTWRHFCSHRHTPIEGEADYPGAVRRGDCIYLMHPVFAQYHQRAPQWCKQLVGNAIELLLPEPALRAEAPSTAIFTLNRQPDRERLVLHALHYCPQRRSVELDIVEDIIPLHEVPVSVRVGGQVAAVRLVPEDEELGFEAANGRVDFVIPRIEGTQMVEIATAR
ncbi:MAG: alpha-amylase family protein [Armatimonadota bacterium]